MVAGDGRKPAVARGLERRCVCGGVDAWVGGGSEWAGNWEIGLEGGGRGEIRGFLSGCLPGGGWAVCGRRLG